MRVQSVPLTAAYCPGRIRSRRAYRLPGAPHARTGGIPVGSLLGRAVTPENIRWTSVGPDEIPENIRCAPADPGEVLTAREKPSGKFAGMCRSPAPHRCTGGFWANGLPPKLTIGSSARVPLRLPGFAASPDRSRRSRRAGPPALPGSTDRRCTTAPTTVAGSGTRRSPFRSLASHSFGTCSCRAGLPSAA